MLNKWITIIIAGVIVLIGLFFSTMLSNQKEPMRRRPNGTNIDQIKFINVQNQDYSPQFEITGHIRAFDKVEIYAEVSGILLNTEKRFREGTSFSKGEILIHIDDAVYKNNLLAQKSGLLNQITLLLPDLSIDFPESGDKWQHYLQKFELNKPLTPLPDPASDQERYYIASRNIYAQYYQIKSMEETHAKYTIEAPYNGVVTQSNINPGTLVRVGQKLGEFTNPHLYELEAAVGINNVEYLKVGDLLDLMSEDIEGNFKGKIQRINQVIDQTTQTVKVYIITSDPKLKDGMFLIAKVNRDPIEDVFRISKDLIYGEQQVFTLKDSILVLQDVEIVQEDDDSFLITGLSSGTRILGQPLADARDGMVLPSNINQISKNRGENE